MYREEILLQNFKNVQTSLIQACKRANRNPSTVTLLAVTKYAKNDDVLTLLRHGVLSDVGESRLQDAWARWHDNPAFAEFGKVKKHFIGHLQKNKAAKAAQLFDYVDSLDDFETARVLAAHVPTGKCIRGLVQVKLTKRATQSGLELTQARQLVKQLQGVFTNLWVCGYMAIAPQGATAEQLRRLFRPLREAFEADFKNQPEAHLSLGMSEDFEVAVEEGSTLPRIGSRLFATHLEEA